MVSVNLKEREGESQYYMGASLNKSLALSISQLQRK
jgi:hypothetical protein